MPATAPANADKPGQQRDPLLALADRCVKCGLCLPACPTYRLDRNEAESPRGRIALARAMADGSLIADAMADAHLDHCLGCRRCEAVCPAGVQYGELLVATRHRQRDRRGADLRQRTIEWLTSRPDLLDRLLGVYRALYPALPKLLPRPPRKRALDDSREPANARSNDAHPSPATVALFRGCLARRYDAGTHVALMELCRAAGIDVVVPEAQTCCGALHAHAGDVDASNELAQRNRAAFGQDIPVLTSATGCHEAIADALNGHASVRDASAFLLQQAERLHFRPATMRVALHVPCTQRAVVRSDGALRRLLARIPELQLIELPDTGCCGAAGTYMFDEPERARALREPLLDACADTGASILLSANVGCRLHLANGVAITVEHPLEFLARHLIEPSP